MMVVPIVDSVLDIGSKIIDRLWPNPEERDKAKLALLEMQQRGELQDIEARMQIIRAEAQSPHWLTANWRPALMLMWGSAITFHIVIFPLINTLFGTSLQLDIPDWMGQTVMVGIGGYIGARTVEKVSTVREETKKVTGGQ